MGDFVGKEEVDRIRAHYRAYMADGALEKGDNRAQPVTGVYEASTFREVSSWYVNRLLRYIEVTGYLDELERTATADCTGQHADCHQCSYIRDMGGK